MGNTNGSTSFETRKLETGFYLASGFMLMLRAT